ncbi:MAG TPA: helix-turn-helix transcriptional regulator [Bacillales bacterium]|nr:helix-turn-helix transcriptional regulator [Bacillales bacterium]
MKKSYSELLTEYIENSGLSYAEIVLRVSNKGINIHKSYISKLKNGTKPPATDDLNRAIAEVTGGDPEDLIVAAYLERAPKEFKKRINLEEQPKENKDSETTDEELEKLLDHPDMGMWFRELKGSPEENRHKALDFLRWLNEQEKKDNQK